MIEIFGLGFIRMSQLRRHKDKAETENYDSAYRTLSIYLISIRPYHQSKIAGIQGEKPRSDFRILGLSEIKIAINEYGQDQDKIEDQAYDPGFNPNFYIPAVIGH